MGVSRSHTRTYTDGCLSVVGVMRWAGVSSDTPAWLFDEPTLVEGYVQNGTVYTTMPLTDTGV